MKLLERAENAVESGHVMNMVFHDQLKKISGSVHASMKDKLYKVEINLDNDSNIIDSYCACPRGRVVCHHIAALALFAHYNISSTDKSCSWSAKKTNGTETVQTVEELFPASRQYVASKSLPTQQDVTEFYNKLKDVGGNVGFCWLLGPKLSNAELTEPIICSISNIISSTEYKNSSRKMEYFIEKVKMTIDKIEKVAEATINQASNTVWLQLKKFCLTASNFGVVLNACKRNKYSTSLYKRLTGSYNLDGIKAIQWGRDNEKCAVEAFCTATGLSVLKTGLWFHECGFIGASPDGLVGDTAVLEIKCPFKYRNANLTDALQNDNNYIIRYLKENQSYYVNEDHDYFHQIQGQLHILKRELCYLVVWTPAQIVIVQIKRSESCADNLHILRNF